MANRITHIRLSSNYASTTEHITHVKLYGGQVQTKADVVRYISSGYQYYYTRVDGSKAEVEVVRPSGREPYIRTKGNHTTKDNLLSLPRF